ncbi:hypothetical protein [Actinospica sp.]|jgi:hypothetical protein|uniref:hypothetical protein n=1 Tax=Actinospica sp. TaxID=1872142 RepID=UPI002BB97924|nr:hypothetical protein [Actinospica sp.]HWG22703.1 hypothetical protein [Actinospica sp.]
MAGPPAHGSSVNRPASYLLTVLHNGAQERAALTDGRKQALSSLAYKVGGYLAASGLSETEVLDRLVAAATASGLAHATAERLARRSLANGQARQLTPSTRRFTAS